MKSWRLIAFVAVVVGPGPSLDPVSPLGEAVGLHPVGEAVGDHLRLRALFGGHAIRIHVEHPRRGRVVDVLAGLERLDQSGILGEMGDAAKLDLVVVGDQQGVALGGHEGPAEVAGLARWVRPPRPCRF